MGLCASNAGSAAASVDRQISREAARDLMAEQNKARLLLLGAGESGKSTFFKQIRLLHGHGFSDDDRREAVLMVREFVLESLKAIIAGVSAVGLEAEIGNREKAEAIKDVYAADGFNDGIAQLVSDVWQDPAVQRLWLEQRTSVQVPDAAEYFVLKVHTVASPTYLPSDQDMLRLRVRTSGIREETFILENGTSFSIIDVGGQRNERRKWIHLFADVHAIMFLSAISEYDQTCFEDETTNRLIESLNLFEETVNNKFLSDKDLVLFLNKRDLFAAKIQQVPINSVEEFADYPGAPASYEEAVQYILDKFQERVRNPRQRKKMVVHETTATDTENVRVVFTIVQQKVLEQNLSALGI